MNNVVLKWGGMVLPITALNACIQNMLMFSLVTVLKTVVVSWRPYLPKKVGENGQSFTNAKSAVNSKKQNLQRR